MTEGELTFWFGGQVTEAPARSFVYGPRDIPHTFEVSSDEAPFLLVAEPAGIEAFMRALAEPAKALELRLQSHWCSAAPEIAESLRGPLQIFDPIE